MSKVQRHKMRHLVVLAAVLVAVAAGGINNRLSVCNASSPTQIWKTGPVQELTNVVNGVTSCLDVSVGVWVWELCGKGSCVELLAVPHPLAFSAACVPGNDRL